MQRLIDAPVQQINNVPRWGKGGHADPPLCIYFIFVFFTNPVVRPFLGFCPVCQQRPPIFFIALIFFGASGCIGQFLSEKMRAQII